MKEMLKECQDLWELGCSYVNASRYQRQLIARDAEIRKDNEAYNKRLFKKAKKERKLADIDNRLAELQALLERAK